MYCREKLEKAIQASGMKLKFLAVKMGLSQYGLQKKIRGENEFKNSEIIIICDALKLSIKQRDEIFFAN